MEISFNEIHFVVLPSQSNIYCFSWLRTTEVAASAKLLVASLKKPIVCFEFNNRPFENLVPSSKEIHFTYIPGGAEIISIDNFNKSFTVNDFAIGITFSKEKAGDAQSTAHYLNIYTEWEPNTEFNLETISQSCLSLELKFVPYKLYHTKMTRGRLKETVWLLSGSDETVHLFREEKGHTYIEYDAADYFSEFIDLRSTVLCMDIVHIEDSTLRLTAFGCEDGYVRAAMVDSSKNETLKVFSVKHDSPISCVKLFKLRNNIQPPSFLHAEAVGDEDKQSGELLDTEDYHLLVISTLEVAVVYWRFLADGLNDQKTLPASDHYDCVQCACVADVDMDGMNEIVIGTYGQQLLVYKYAEMIELQAIARSLSNEGSFSSPVASAAACKQHFTLIYQRKFAYPLLAVDYFDVTGDGLKELVVLSVKGLHILQHNLDDVCKTLTIRLEQLTQHQSHLNDAFRQLQEEEI